jgi:hypothetical protein
MINANELRIGNIVLSKPLFGNDKTYKETIIGASEILRCVNNSLDFDPIPLTEEWLLKCGGVHLQGKPNNQYRIGDRLIMERGKYFYDYASNVKLEFVHTFQNFIYALTGTELTIK